MLRAARQLTAVSVSELDDTLVIEAPRASSWPLYAGYARPWGVRITLTAILAVALGLRLWGIKQGLPAFYAYNADENPRHFLPYAIGAAVQLRLRPASLLRQPPALTLPAALRLSRCGSTGAPGSRDALALHPTEVFVVARVTVAVLGATISVWLLYVAGERLFDRGVGLLAAALMAVAFLPVFYLTPGAQRRARARAAPPCHWSGRRASCEEGEIGNLTTAIRRDRARAPGVRPSTRRASSSCPLFVAAIVQFLSPAPQRRALGGMLLAGLLAIAFFLIANPYAIFDAQSFKNGLLVHPVDRQRGGARASSERAEERAAASSTTCGRSPGDWAGRRR